QQPLPRDDLPDQAEERALAPVLRAFGGDRDRARAAWAFAHGMVTLELAGRFPPNADLATAWNSGIDGIAAQAGLGAGARRTRKDDSND
ncbi:MAG: TetR-like C-terminal domain-containing protein, partial [Acidimicrobiia bacterium]